MCEHSNLAPPSCFNNFFTLSSTSDTSFVNNGVNQLKLSVLKTKYYPRKKKTQSKFSKLQREELFDQIFRSYFSLIVRVVFVKLAFLWTMGRRWFFTGQDIFHKKSPRHSHTLCNMQCHTRTNYANRIFYASVTPS